MPIASLILSASYLVTSAAPQPEPAIRVAREWTINKLKGRIDEVLLFDGGFVVRDSDYNNEQTQAIEIFDPQGRFVRKLGGFGRGPGEYYRLKDIALVSDSSIVALDMLSRVTWFSRDGEVLKTKLIQNPGYYLREFQFDESRERLYLSGCKAKQYYLDKGCTLVHLYQGADLEYRRSFWETEPEAVENNYFSLEDYFIDLDAEGRIVASDAPIRKVFRIDANSGKIEVFPIQSDLMKPLGRLDPTNTEEKKRTYQSSYLIRKILTTKNFIVVSILRVDTNDHRLAILGQQGRQIGVDVRTKGLLVGRTESGGLLFAEPAEDGFKLWEGQIDAPREAQ